MKALLLELLVTLWMISGNCAVDRPSDDLVPRSSSEPIPNVDTESGPSSSPMAIHNTSPNSFGIQHLVADFYGCTVPSGAATLEAILREAATAAGATALNFSHHKFEPDGVSAVLMLGESHISVHYWYEKHYALVDVVTCGICNPYAAIDILNLSFKATTVTVHDLIRPFK